jgi:predicted DNA-binding WGR domain protein
MKRYELVEGGSSKFWEVQAEGTTLTVRFGRIGTKGQTQEKSFANAEAATNERDKLTREKTKKGYKSRASPPR